MRRQMTILGAALSLVALILSGIHLFNASHAKAAYTWIGPKQYYLGLGDSLAFGYQPDLDWNHGYVQDFSANIKTHGASTLEDYGCNGETSNTMINGGCPYWYTNHVWYFSPQLTAAVNFIKGHPGQVSPVTLDMGANDVLPDINKSTCAVSANWATDLATLHSNLVNTILPKLTTALKNSSGQRTGDLVMMNYYDPFINSCPGDLGYIHQLNAEIATDAAQFGIPLVDTYSAFGGDNQGANICNYTYICGAYNDIHATSAGYQVIANAFVALTGY
jgi:lysophospholipase L1-like esterase